MQKHFKPGQKVPESGQYAVLVQKIRGGHFKRLAGHQVTCVKGEPFPPYDHPGARAIRYILGDHTLHEGG